MMRSRFSMRAQSGFSLLELSLVLLIVSLISYSAIEPLGRWQAARQHRTTDNRLQRARQALIGYAQAFGRLPCPLSADGLGVDAGGNTGMPICRAPEGFLPATALGVSGPLDRRGALLDSWHRPIRYRLADAMTRAEGAGLLLRLLERLPDQQDVQICHRGQGRRCTGQALLSSDVVFIVWSDGADAATAGDQQANQDGDRRFVSGPISSLATDPFDDQLVWMSRSELVYWLVAARQ